MYTELEHSNDRQTVSIIPKSQGKTKMSIVRAHYHRTETDTYTYMYTLQWVKDQNEPEIMLKYNKQYSEDEIWFDSFPALTAFVLQLPALLCSKHLITALHTAQYPIFVAPRIQWRSRCTVVDFENCY